MEVCGNTEGVLIFFATQTGRSERTAQRISELLRQQCVTSEIMDLEHFDATIQPKVPCIFVVSTYGDGSSPDSCREFEKLMKKGLDMFNGTPCAVLGHGHTAFTNFCGFSRQLVQSLNKAGASIFHDPLYICDQQLTTDILEVWMAQLVEKVICLVPKAAVLPAVVGGADELKGSYVSHISAILTQPKPANSSCKPFFGLSPAKMEEVVVEGIPGRQTYSVLLRWEQATNLLYPGCSITLLARPSNEVEVKLTSSENQDSSTWQTSSSLWSEILLEIIDFGDQKIEGLKFWSTDPVSRFPNGTLVSDILDFMIDWTASVDVEVWSRLLCPHIGSLDPITEDELPYIDLRTVIASIRTQRAFKIPLAVILNEFPLVQPRAYTVADYNPADDTINLIVKHSSSSHQQAGWSSVPIRHGRVSGLLNYLASNRCVAEPCFLSRSNCSVFQPDHWRSKGLWICTGSGIAPFLSFLLERLRQDDFSDEGTVLVAGFRSTEEIIGLKVLVRALKRNLIARVFLALSREPIGQQAKELTGTGNFLPFGCNAFNLAPKTYVSDLIREASYDKTTDFGSILVCGSKGLGESVKSCIKQDMIMEVW